MIKLKSLIKESYYKNLSDEIVQHNDCYGKKISNAELTESMILTEAHLRGEWWFQDGSAHFADGDVGDINHAGMVMDTIMREILIGLGVDTDMEHVGEISDFTEEIFEEIGDKLTPEEIESWNEGEYWEVITSYLERNGDADIKEKVHYVSKSSEDPREYALRKWGWHRVKGNVIQTQTLTSRDLQYIVSGLYEAYGEELDEKNTEDVTDDNPFGEVTFNIEVISTRSWYTGIPISILEKKNPVALSPYRNRY